MVQARVMTLDGVADYLEHVAWQFEATSGLKKRKADRAAQMSEAKGLRFAAELLRLQAWGSDTCAQSCTTCGDPIHWVTSNGRWFHDNGDDLQYDHRAEGPDVIPET